MAHSEDVFPVLEKHKKHSEVRRLCETRRCSWRGSGNNATGKRERERGSSGSIVLFVLLIHVRVFFFLLTNSRRSTVNRAEAARKEAFAFLSRKGEKEKDMDTHPSELLSLIIKDLGLSRQGTERRVG